MFDTSLLFIIETLKEFQKIIYTKRKNMKPNLQNNNIQEIQNLLDKGYVEYRKKENILYIVQNNNLVFAKITPINKTNKLGYIYLLNEKGEWEKHITLIKNKISPKSLKLLLSSLKKLSTNHTLIFEKEKKLFNPTIIVKEIFNNECQVIINNNTITFIKQLSTSKNEEVKNGYRDLKLDFENKTYKSNFLNIDKYDKYLNYVLKNLKL